MRWSAIALVVACRGTNETPKLAPSAPVDAAAVVAAIDAAPAPRVEPGFDDPLDFEGRGKREMVWQGPVPPKPAVAPIAPGIHPVLVRNSAPQDDETAFFILGCAKVDKGKPTKFLDGRACAPLLQNVQLEMVLENSRVPVRVVGRGMAFDCPWASESKRPFVRLAGIPKTAEGEFAYGEIVSKGMARYTGPVDADVLAAIRKVEPLTRTKRPNGYGPHPSDQYDLDGDGTFEVIMSMEGMALSLFASDGTLIGRLGCYVG
jgi:hypothetical protein